MVSRFAVADDIFTSPFSAINKRLLEITDQYKLIDHHDINQKRFSQWFNRIECTRSFYGSRFWEYPFAILAAKLQPGLKCADIGCGTTPFTPYLCEIVGKENVSGFDPDYVPFEEEARHLSFGARKSHIEQFGFAFFKNDFVRIEAPDNSFDRVFCISVLEHIEDSKVKQQGLQEMVRILKPGGKLIITFDTGMAMPFNPPLKIIELTGLIPDNGLDLQWPEFRFVDYGESCIDVFGLVLQKPTGEIYTDYKKTQKIPSSSATQKYVNLARWFNVPYESILMLKDLEKPLGTLKFLAKRILNRY